MTCLRWRFRVITAVLLSVAACSSMASAGTLLDVTEKIITPSARDLRLFRQETLPGLIGICTVGTLVALVAFFAVRGRNRIVEGRSGRWLVRFSRVERWAHWVLATTFLLLALTGLNKAVGRHTVQLLVSAETYGAFSRGARTLHNGSSFVFSAVLLVVIALWLRDNRPTRVDARWLRAGGGLLTRAHPSAERFNAGQKIVFWLVAIGGATQLLTGYNLMYPDVLISGGALRLASQLHGVMAALLIAVMLAHAFIGSIGTEGALDGMRHGRVDENWARQHHDLWAAYAETDDAATSCATKTKTIL